jgi:hypothetical protein
MEQETYRKNEDGRVVLSAHQLTKAILATQGYLAQHGEVAVEWGDLEGIEVICTKVKTHEFEKGTYVARLVYTSWGYPYGTYTREEIMLKIKAAFEEGNQDGFHFVPTPPHGVAPDGSFKHEREVQQAYWN